MGDHSPSTLGLGRFAVGDQEGFVKVKVGGGDQDQDEDEVEERLQGVVNVNVKVKVNVVGGDQDQDEDEGKERLQTTGCRGREGDPPSLLTRYAEELWRVCAAHKDED